SANHTVNLIALVVSHDQVIKSSSDRGRIRSQLKCIIFQKCSAFCNYRGSWMRQDYLRVLIERGYAFLDHGWIAQVVMALPLEILRGCQFQNPVMVPASTLVLVGSIQTDTLVL